MTANVSTYSVIYRICRGLRLENLVAFSTPNGNKSEYVPVDTKPVWLVPCVTGVDQRNILKIISVFWNIPGMKDQTRETVTFQSLTAGVIRLRGLETIQVVQLLPEAVSQGGRLSRFPQTGLLKTLYFPTDLLFSRSVVSDSL